MPDRRSPRIVHGEGPPDARVVLIGEGPGVDEDKIGRPFVGVSGRVLDDLLARAGVARSDVWVTNLLKRHIYGNLDPKPHEVAEDKPLLDAELAAIRPELIITMGAFATRHFLGPGATMDMVHGLLHESPARDVTHGKPILPVYHPAAGLHDTDMLASIYWDFEQVEKAFKGALRPHNPTPMDTEVVPIQELAESAAAAGEFDLAIDTEFDPRTQPPRPWGLSITHAPHTASVVLADDAEGLLLVHALAEQARYIYIHNLLADLPVLDQLLPHFDLRPHCLPGSQPRIIDTMVLSYHQTIWPQGLKPLVYRLARSSMGSFEDLVRPVQLEMALDWLHRANQTQYPPPQEEAKVDEATGRVKFSKPWSLNRRIKRILSDWVKDPDGVDPTKRWGNIKPHLQQPAIDAHGAFPVVTVFDADQAKATQYAGEDADGTFRIAPVLMYFMKREGLQDILDVDMPAIPLVDHMQTVGMPVDADKLNDLAEEMTVRSEALQVELEDLVGHKLNPNSPDQVAEVLFDELGLEASRLTATGKRSTSKKVLTPHRADNPVVHKVLLFKELLKIKTSFCANITRRTERKRVHANIRVTRAKTGRLATTEPNLLAIPVRTAEGRRVRHGFVAPPGRVFGAFDLNQIEMRVMAHCAVDLPLIEIYNRSADQYPKHERCVHTMTAASVYDVKPEDVQPLQRTMAKSTGFGIIMGISGHGLAAQLSLYGLSGHSVEDCSKFIDEWLQLHPGVRDFQLSQRAYARRFGYVKDLYGRRYLLPGAVSSVSRVAEEALRQSHALVIQGGAQGLMKLIMRECEYELIPTLAASGIELEPLLQIHDELVFLLPEDAQPPVEAAVLNTFTRDRDLRVPIEASGSFGPSWGELEK